MQYQITLTLSITLDSSLSSSITHIPLHIILIKIQKKYKNVLFENENS